MANEPTFDTNDLADLDTVEDVEAIVETKDDGDNDTTDWKSIAQKRQEAAEKNAGIIKRLKTKLEKSKIDKKVEAKVEEQLAKKGLDRLDKAILRVEKITEADEVKLVEDMVEETGKDVETLLASRFFQSELKALREAKETKNATPNGSKRSGQSGRDEVDYWIEKGELPPQDQQALRQKVVARKRETAKSKNQFTDIPVA